MNLPLNQNFIIDNGSSYLRVGTANADSNILSTENMKGLNRKTGISLIGSDLENALNEDDLIYEKPHTRGVLMNFNTQIPIWEKLLLKLVECEENKSFEGNSLAMAFHPFSPDKVVERVHEIAFEYFGFSYFKPVLCQEAIESYISEFFPESELIIISADERFRLIVESSNSATYFVPFYNSNVINGAIRRMEVGGNMLTKMLQKSISFRQIDLSKSYRLTRDIKEKTFYICQSLKEEIKKELKLYEEDRRKH